MKVKVVHTLKSRVYIGLGCILTNGRNKDDHDTFLLSRDQRRASTARRAVQRGAAKPATTTKPSACGRASTVGVTSIHVRGDFQLLRHNAHQPEPQRRRAS